MMPRVLLLVLLSVSMLGAAEETFDYRVLATNKTSTMEKEMNEAAEAGFRMEKVMGGATMSGSEVVVVMSKNKSEAASGRQARLTPLMAVMVPRG